MAENNSKTFIIGIIIFVVLVIGGFAFFAKKDVSVDQTTEEAAVTAPATTEGEAAADAVNLEPVPAPEAAPTPVPTPADEVTPTAPTPAYEVEATPAPEAAPAEAAPAAAPEATPAP
ncbi:MAG TPA: hypothetical protein VIN59_00490 [Alphaproteobacteria bacterium]